MNTVNTKFLNLPFIAGAALVSIFGGSGLIVLLLFTGNKESNSDTPSSHDHAVVQSLVLPDDDSNRDDSSEQSIQRIADLSKYPSHFSRSIALGKLLSEVDFQHALKLLDESKQLSDLTVRQSTQVEIFRRLASLEPERALSHTHDYLRVQRKLYQSVVCQEWSYKDIDSLVAYTEQHLRKLDSEDTIMILHSILNSGHALSEETQRDIARRFNLEYYFDSLEDRALRLAMQENPVKHWNLLLGDSLSDHDQIDDLVSIALAVIENDGFDAFRTLHTELSDRRIRNEVLSEVLIERSWSDTDDIESVFNDAVSLLDDTNRSIVFDIAERWFQLDPSATFIALSQLEDKGLRDNLFEITALHLADSNPLRALELLESLPETIRGVVVYAAVFDLAVRDPIEAVKHLSKITQYQERADETPESAKDVADRIANVAFNLFANWAEFDAVAAFEWLLSDPTVAHVHNDRNIHFELARAVTANNAEALIEIALKQPDDVPNVAFEGIILSNLAALDFDRARDLLPKMREGPARILGHATIGAGFFYRDNDPEQSIKFGMQLPVSDRAEYYLLLAERWARHNAEETYANLDLLPSSAAQARAASTLIEREGWAPALSDEQLEHLKSYLPDEKYP